MRKSPSGKRSWPADYVLELISVCFDAGLNIQETQARVKQACLDRMTAAELKIALGPGEHRTLQ